MVYHTKKYSLTSSTINILNRLRSPIWLVNPKKQIIEWANPIALTFWKLNSLEQLNQQIEQEKFKILTSFSKAELELLAQFKSIHKQWIICIQKNSFIIDGICFRNKSHSQNWTILVEGIDIQPQIQDREIEIQAPINLNYLTYIQEQQNNFNLLINSLPGIVFIGTNKENWSIRFLSEGCIELTGYRPEELTTQKDFNYNSLIYSEDFPLVRLAIEEASKTQRAYEIEYRVFTKNGQEKWFWEKGHFIYNEQNQVQGIKGFITDITQHKNTEKALRENEERYRLLAENSTDLISRHHADGSCIYTSSVSQSLLGYEPEKIIGKFISDLCHPQDLQIVEQFYIQIQQQLNVDPIIYRIRHHSGHYLWIETTAKIILNANTGTIQEFIAVSRDITKRKQAEEALRRADVQYKNIFENVTQGIFQITQDGRYLKANTALAKLYGYDSPEDLINDLTNIEYQLYVDSQHRNTLIQQIEKQGLVANFESQIYRKDGSIIWISETTRAVYDEQNNFLYYEGTVEDITYRRLTEAKLLHDAFHDALTGLPNRAWFMNQLQEAITKVLNSSNLIYAVLFIDLDGFKVVNDSLGHFVGDELLKKVAQRLKRELRSYDKVARFGGDEFVILLEKVKDTQNVIKIAERIKEHLKIPFKLGSETVFTSASVGITLSTFGYKRPEELLRDADIAMYQAKAQGKACYAMFDPQIQKAIFARLQLENDLRQAIEKQQFCLYYQPIIALSTGHLTSFEALIRWHHPSRGWIPPSEFIPIAEETGLIHPLGRWVLHEACHQLQQWQQEFPQAFGLEMNVNLSARQLMEIGLVQRIDQMLQQKELKGCQLKLEITESCFLETIANQACMVQQLKDLGIGLCIDDFGTGYSSLSRLHEFPIDTLKIDRSFIHRLESHQTAIVQTIITLAHTLNMNVVAEGIETSGQLEKLKALGCELGQGYFFSRPVDATTASQLIREMIKPNVSVLAG